MSCRVDILYKDGKEGSFTVSSSYSAGQLLEAFQVFKGGRGDQVKIVDKENGGKIAIDFEQIKTIQYSD